MTKQNNTPDVSVVIVSYNTRDLLRECLQTVYRETGLDYEVIVVDNASRDGSLEMVGREFPSVVAIQTGANLGFAAANNVAFRRARGQYVLLLNSDAFLTPGTLLKAVSLMKASPATGLAGGRLVGRDGGWQASARLFPSLLNDFLSLSGLAARFPRSRMGPSPTTVSSMGYASFNSFIASKSRESALAGIRRPTKTMRKGFPTVGSAGHGVAANCAGSTAISVMCRATERSCFVKLSSVDLFATRTTSPRARLPRAERTGLEMSRRG